MAAGCPRVMNTHKPPRGKTGTYRAYLTYPKHSTLRTLPRAVIGIGHLSVLTYSPTCDWVFISTGPTLYSFFLTFYFISSYMFSSINCIVVPRGTKLGDSTVIAQL